MRYFLTLLVSMFFFQGCSEDYLSQVNSPSILKQDIQCMNLVLLPPNKDISDTLHQLYNFDTKCELDLVVSYKSSIVCNSNQNAGKKALGMAKSYLRLELKRGKRLLYSYYIDLADNLENEDVKNGFNVLKGTLPFKAK